MNTLILNLPYPPSANNYWRNVGARVLISRAGRVFREEVSAIGYGPRPLRGRLNVEIEVHPPDRRRRDLDNVCKATLDALQHAGVYVDDSQIDRLLLERQPRYEGGKLRVTVTEV